MFLHTRVALRSSAAWLFGTGSSLRRRFNKSQTCSSGFISGLHAGHGSILTLLALSSCCVVLAAWQGALSWASIIPRLALTWGIRTGLMISVWYRLAFKFPFIRTIAVLVCMEIPAHTRIEPPPNCWVSTTQSSFALSPPRRYTRVLPSLPFNFILVSSTNKTLAQSARVNLKCRLAQAKRATRCLCSRRGVFIGRRGRNPESRKRVRMVDALTGRLWMPTIRLAVVVAGNRRERSCVRTISMSWRLVVTLRFGRRWPSATLPVWLYLCHKSWIVDTLVFNVLATLNTKRFLRKDVFCGLSAV